MKTLASIALSLLADAAGAAVLVDRSPDVTGGVAGAILSNFAGGQNFLVGIDLAGGGSISGFDLYSSANDFYGPTAAIPGRGVLVKIRTDDAGRPAETNLQTITTVLSAVDSVGSSADPRLQRFHADFGPVVLAAGRYWIGMSALAPEIGWSRMAVAGPPVWQLQGGDTLGIDRSNLFNLAYRIHGDTVMGSVPEPASWAMLIAGFGLTGAVMRRRRTAAVTA